MDLFNLERIIKYLPGIIIGLTVHEFCHAWVAHLCGDPTSKEQGRVTLNPLKHIDLMGFIFLLATGFGWAKPVQFNEEKLRRKTDVMKIALAGPFSNALLAMVVSFLFVIMEKRPEMLRSDLIREIILSIIFINWGLFIFNLIPVPPLDGSHLLFFPLRRHPEIYNTVYRYGSFLFFGLLLATMLTNINFLPVGKAMEFLTKGFLGILGYHSL